jgi:hypothetical protein
MSYLSTPTSATEYGVVQIGDFIEVADGVISLLQDVSPTADVTFDGLNITTNIGAAGNISALGSISGDSVFDDGNRVITSVTPTAGNGISLSSVVDTGPDASFTVTNTGVLSLIAGSGISISASTGNITISSFGADLINVTGVTSNYTASVTDEYIGVFSASAVTITLPTGFDGRVYTIKDEYGQGSGKITIKPQTGELIDGKVNYVISVPNQSVNVVSRASNWWII